MPGHNRTSCDSSPRTGCRWITSISPPLPARPRNSTLAIGTRRRSSSFQTAARDASSQRAGRSRAVRRGRWPSGRGRAVLAEGRLAGRTRTPKPAASNVQLSGSFTAAAGPARPPAARARRRMTSRAPLLKPGHAIAHDRLPDPSRFARLGCRAGRTRPASVENAPSRSPGWSPVWSPFFCRAPTFAGSQWRGPNRAEAANALVLRRFGSQ
jgi:hypothetical protein